jgi:hypothetical protein
MAIKKGYKLKCKSYKPGQLVRRIVSLETLSGIVWERGIVISDSPSKTQLSKRYYLQVLWLNNYKIENSWRDNVFSL